MLNVALHALNACLLYVFGLRIGFKRGVSCAAALLWAVHPLYAATDVTHIASTAELLWSGFCLAGLIMLLPDFSPRRIWMSLAFFVLAALSKETAVVFPALATATFFYVSRDRTTISRYKKLWPLWAFAAVYISLLIGSVHKFSDVDSGIAVRIFTFLATLPVYARLIVLPVGLHYERVIPVFTTLFAGLPLAGLLMVVLAFAQIAWGRAQRGLTASFGIMWFAIALSPYAGIVFPINALLSEGWMYMPCMGLFLTLTSLAAPLFEKRENLARILVVVLVIMLGAGTIRQSQTWETRAAVLKNIPADEEYTSKLHLELGLLYMREGMFDKAIAHIQHELDHDGLSKLLQSRLHMHLAMAWLHIPPDEGGETFTLTPQAIAASPHISEAVHELGIALEDDPGYGWVHAALAFIYRAQGSEQMARFHENQAKDVGK